MVENKKLTKRNGSEVIKKKKPLAKKIKMIKVESGSIVTDIYKKRWIIEDLIGLGGFGQVFKSKFFKK